MLPIHSLNISNECSLEVEKCVRNVVDDVVSSHGVVVENALVMLWSDRDTVS